MNNTTVVRFARGTCGANPLALLPIIFRPRPDPSRPSPPGGLRPALTGPIRSGGAPGGRPPCQHGRLRRAWRL